MSPRHRWLALALLGALLARPACRGEEGGGPAPGRCDHPIGFEAAGAAPFVICWQEPIARADALLSRILPRCAAGGAKILLRSGQSLRVDGGCELRRGRIGGRARLVLGLRIDPNEASAADLEALPRIGPVLARRIVKERQSRRYESLQDLERVKGIGPATVRRLRPLLRLTSVRRGARPGAGDGR